MRRKLSAVSLASSVALVTGCYLTSDFGRFDTSPEERMEEAGPPIILSGKVTLSATPAKVVVRPGAPARITVKALREGNVPASAVTVRLEKLPAGLSSRDEVIAPNEGEKILTVELAPGDAGAALLSAVITSNVTGTVTDPDVTGVASTSAAIEVWGKPGDVDPTRGPGNLVFAGTTLLKDQSVGLAPIRVADFVGTTFAIAVREQLHTLDTKGVVGVADLGIADSGAFGQTSTAVADGDVLNVVANVLADVTPPFRFDTKMKRGPLGALTALPVIDGGGRCAVDREGRRIACRAPADPSATTFKAPLRTLEGSTPGAILHDIDGADVATIVHTSKGWVVVGTLLASPTNPTPLLLMEVVDDLGLPTSGFVAEAQTVPSYIYDAITDDDGIVVAGSDQQGAFIVKYGWTGAVLPSFGGGARVRFPGDGVLRVIPSASGLLVLSSTRPANPPKPLIGRVSRVNPKTGAMDTTFGENGTVTLAGLTGPVAAKEVGSRILVGYLSENGARVAHLFP